MPEITLMGCASDPIASNLKALGILRIVAEQVDSNVKACWRNDNFILDTKLTKEELIKFFSEKYLPTPIVSPWNHGSNFYVKPKNMDSIINSKDNRMKEYQVMIEKTKQLIIQIIPEYHDFLETIKQSDDKTIKKNAKPIKELLDKKKDIILRQCRNQLDEKIIPWLDTAYVAIIGKPLYGPILGTGGNDSNFDISTNFMRRVSELLIKNDSKKSVYLKRKILLHNSLFGEYAELEGSSFAYFHPGRYISKAICGKDNYSVLNPWDFILTIEGTMLFAGSISRRSNSSYAAFPFTTSLSSAGYSTASAEEVRGEIWIPLWDNFASYPEIKHLFNEGRAQINSKNVDTGVDFARSVVNLGTERGITDFHRFGLFKRKGQAFFAINLGNINTKIKPAVRLLSELDAWLQSVKDCPDKLKTKTMRLLLREMDDAIIKFCMYATPRYLQQILVMAGKIEQFLSYSSDFKKHVDPMPNLNNAWVKACYDDTPEYRLAVSLASIYSPNNPIRKNLLPIKYKIDPKWKSHDPSAVWKNTTLIENLIAILKRRCMESQMTKGKIQLDSIVPAPLKDVMQFLNGKLDHKKIAELLPALSTIQYNRNKLPNYCNKRKIWDLPEFIPEQYIVLKSNYPPINNIEDENSIFEPNVLGLVKSYRVNEAVRIMRRRMVISGYPVLTYSSANSFTLEQTKQKTSQLLASLLFPIRKSDLKKFISEICVIKS